MLKECPYCKAEMIEGFIYSGKYSFKWYTEEMSFFAKYLGPGGEFLHENTEVKSSRCMSCNKIIIDIDAL